MHQNAEQLYNEACILHEQGALSRALFLHQISMEECGKIELIGGWTSNILMGEAVDIQRLSAAMASHKAKNYANAYLLNVSAEEHEARARGDWRSAMEAFAKRKTQFHEESNTAKNASLYVDLKDGEFGTPEQRINEEMVSAIATVNWEFLGLTRLKVDMLAGYEDRFDELSTRAALLKKRLTELREELPDDPEKALAEVMEELLKARRGPEKDPLAADSKHMDTELN